MQIRLMFRLSRDAKQAIAIIAAAAVGLPALVTLPMVPRAIRESRRQPSSSDSVGAIAFSRDQRILVSATSGPPWEATSTLWDVTDQAQPRRLSVALAGRCRARPPGRHLMVVRDRWRQGLTAGAGATSGELGGQCPVWAW